MEDARASFTGDAEWDRYCVENGIVTNTNAPNDEIVDLKPQIGDMRADGEKECGQWNEEHPLSELGYETRVEQIKVRDGEEVNVKIYSPKALFDSQGHDGHNLPLLLFSHGGGFFMGSPASEDRWILHHLLQQNSMIVVSPDYRLAPENAYPTQINDCWDVLKNVINRHDTLHFDRKKIVLGGTSAGGCIAAALSQRARDDKIPIQGVLLNVPVLCDYRYWPEETYGPNHAYEQSRGDGMLSAGEMRGTWTMVVPEGQGGTAQASPLLGTMEELPPHLVFIAGKDPLRDEARAYVQKLKEADVKVESFLYPGVPHQFSNSWELEATKNFREDLNGAWKRLVREN